MTKLWTPEGLEERERALEARRELKKTRNVHAFVRGEVERFYAWLDTTSGRAMPSGPTLWICGDCHVGNLGPLAGADGHVEIAVRDLDQTVIGNPAHDVIRLALSLAMVARDSSLAGVTTARMVEEIVRGYEAAFAEPEKDPTQDRGCCALPVRLTLREALHRSWRHMRDERRVHKALALPLGTTFWPLTTEERAAVLDLCATESVRRIATSLGSRDKKAQVFVIDAAFWVKGCSSLGGWRVAALIDVARRKSEVPRHVGLLDIKAALPACSPACPHPVVPADEAERVVTGARSLSPFLGNRMVAATLLEKPVVVRELLPQDLKIEIERISEKEARETAHFLGWVVGVAHARQLDPGERAAWLAELAGRRTKNIDAPTWLWESVVQLVSLHEGAYLEHCRRYALQAAA